LGHLKHAAVVNIIHCYVSLGEIAVLYYPNKDLPAATAPRIPVPAEAIC
jgi:hypothetical protein